MNPNKSIEDFSSQFLHLCYEFLEEDSGLYLFKQKMDNLVHIYLHSESKAPQVSTPPTILNHGSPIISNEEPNTYFVHFHPFPVLIEVPLCVNFEVGKSINHNSDPSLQVSSTSHDPNPMDETLEWFMEARVKNNPFIYQDGISGLNLTVESSSTEFVTF